MTIDVSSIIEGKLAQMEKDGIIQKKIEEVLEKNILSAITQEFESYSFTRDIREQMRTAVSGVAEQSGLAAYNGFIAEKVRQIVQDAATDDLTAKLQTALEGVLLKKHEGVKLSDIFKRYHAWVCENTDEDDKYDRERYTAELAVEESGNWTRYDARFADRPDANKPYSFDSNDRPDIDLHLSVYGNEGKTKISTLRLNGSYIDKQLRIGILSEFEAFLVNLYYNRTEILVDMEDADDYGYFDIDI